jgi:hypothetical protein
MSKTSIAAQDEDGGRSGLALVVIGIGGVTIAHLVDTYILGYKPNCGIGAQIFHDAMFWFIGVVIGTIVRKK